MARRDVSDGRKMLYYAGLALLVIGFLTFGSVFVTTAVNFGNFDNFESRTSSFMTRAVVGMGMMIAGGFLTTIGRAGLAGSGLVLDPEQAREDMEPWSRMKGGMIKDALDETGINLSDINISRRAGGSDLDFAERLRKLHALREEGILTEEEYQREKAEVLGENE